MLDAFQIGPDRYCIFELKFDLQMHDLGWEVEDTVNFLERGRSVISAAIRRLGKFEISNSAAIRSNSGVAVT